jgi:hypothetical protein
MDLCRLGANEYTPFCPSGTTGLMPGLKPISVKIIGAPIGSGDCPVRLDLEIRFRPSNGATGRTRL